jgi:cell division protease FtsH
MSDQEPIGPEKGRRSRSFGTFLLVLLVLVVVALIFGRDGIGAPDRLSQDEYLWYLHKGDVVAQSVQGSEAGSNLVVGTYRKPGQPGETRFEVKFSTLEGLEEEIRQLKGIGTYSRVSPEAFLRAVEEGWYSPVDARLLTSFRRQDAPTGGETASEPTEEDGRAVVERVEFIERDQRVLVKVDARSSASWRLQNRGIERPEFPLPDDSSALHLDVQLAADGDLPGLLAALTARRVPIERLNFDLSTGKGTRWTESSKMLTTILLVYGPWILIFIFIMLFMRQMRSQGGAGGVMSFGRSRATLYSKENRTNVTFGDVAGSEEAKSEVREVVEFLKNPARFSRIGGRIPRGVLLVGPPGCGKTLLAKAIAGEAEVPFYSISGSDFVEMFVGVGASRVRDLFKQARENSPCIIFLDEIDAVGRRRGSGMGGGHDEREQTLNAILVEMDGFGTDEGIIVVAATNRPDVLDPALLRPGRFDREVAIDYADIDGRAAIIAVHLKKVRVGGDVDVKVLAKSTPGYSGADLAAVVNEAAIMAVLDKRDEISMSDLEEARDKVRYGRQKKDRKIEEADRRITARHEAGHAIVAAVLDEVDSPHKVTIVPRGRALGATMVLPERESYHMQKKRMLGQLCMLFGGRVAEALFCGDISAGASDDIKRATELCRAMVAELGMSEKIGPVNYAERQGSDFLGTEIMRSKLHSEDTAKAIDEEIARVLREAYDRAEALITENREATLNVAEALMVYETLTGAEVDELLAGKPVDELRPEPPPTQAPQAAPESAAREDSQAAEDGHAPELPGSPGFSPA